METDFISRDEIIRKRHGCKKNCASCDFAIDGDSWCQGELFIIDVLKAPAADVRPVVRGKWLDTETAGIKETVCSVCFHTGWHHLNYCPNCGADMRDGGDDNHGKRRADDG